jgi:hypothetical protein
MQENTDNFCILIASHISNSKRIGYLKECIESLLKQSVIIQIYLSISFENQVLKDEFEIVKRNVENNNDINIFIRDEKTPQMRHYYLLLETIKNKHKWIMFCDDDDTYKIDRVENIIKSVYIVEEKTKNETTSIFSGLYESHCEKDHREHRHEYWCYCVNKIILDRFYSCIKEYPDIIDNKCCDILFGEYMRRLGQGFFFARLDSRLYNYRVEENQDSITGVIQSKQNFYTRSKQHPPLGDPQLPEYILDWNDYLYEHLDAYLHDVFLRTIVGCNIEYILQAEFRNDYELLKYVDDCHIEKIRNKYEYWREVCGKLYDIKIN